MIERSRIRGAAAVVRIRHVHAARVHLPVIVRVYSDRNDADVRDGRLQRVIAAHGQIDASRDIGEFRSVHFERARSVYGCVRGLAFEIVLAVLCSDQIVKGGIHESALASVAAIAAGRDLHVLHAIDEVLFGKGGQIFGESRVLTFERCDGGECPAAAALCLIFDGIDDAVIAPVDGCRQMRVYSERRIVCRRSRVDGLRETVTHCVKLGGCLVGERVERKSPWSFMRFVFVYASFVVYPDARAGTFNVGVRVRDVPRFLPCMEIR